ncbi:hypothetical protein M408DRAFT_7406 [Serendipita vermifera MAFF 305830]|uniref:P/Homo B domain-containing protein n=1 Tax=Serendipita vermifera MAFF 305830 TaxID=933852 RepID=A0A0C3BHM5_SERVB|nr:hypothetical protein M408DRAFT_7406 [Serendipita vermifera MAFF 305830]
MRLAQLLLLLSPVLQASSRPSRKTYDTHDYYVIHHNPAHGHSPQDSAAALGTEFVEQVGELKDHYLVRIEKSSASSLDRRSPEAGPGDAVVASFHNLKRSEEPIAHSVRSLLPQTLRQRTKRAPIPSFPELDEIQDSLDIHDPIFSSQWHIVNKEFPQHMMNVTGLWKEGVTGKGVISALVDDGLDYESEDLKVNFYAAGSYDFNDHEPLPKPKLWDDRHGTRCAGEIAAAKNDVCGVGLAYESKVAGLRILSGPISDADESAALNYGFQENAIYSCSWGPPDSGRDMEGPNLLIQKAVLNGINNGRGGKGSVFVFASGNGAGSGDACNFDGYTNSIYSVTVGAIDNQGLHPYYSEACAANMIVTYSSGSGKHISTTDVGQKTCSHQHGGTSAAAPLAVGVFALALDVRPDLTWRDIQHLCVYSAAIINPEDPDWEVTASGRPFSYKYGYGKLDAWAYVTMARTWNLVKPQVWMDIATVELRDAAMVGTEMTGGEPIVPEGVSSSTTVTQEMLEEWNFEKLEHITVQVWIRHTRRGDVEVELISPAGIKSVLASQRRFDSATTGFVGWKFMTLKHWDENPVGKWTVRVKDQNNTEKGYFLGWSMTMWGSAIDASLAEKFELTDEHLNLPPAGSEQTKHHPKPTAHLPDDHASQMGEATRPAFQDDKSGTETATGGPTSFPDAAEAGMFDNIERLMSNQLWLIGAFSVVILFAAGAGLFFWLRKRRARRARSAYAPLPGDTMPMRSLDPRGAPPAGSGVPGPGERSAGGTRELYDAFGVGSDEEDEGDADEHSALTGGAGRYGQNAAPATYHDGFLDDNGLTSARTTGAPYRDDVPDVAAAGATRAKAPSPHRAGSDGSGDGSWQDAAADHEAAPLRP